MSIFLFSISWEDVSVYGKRCYILMGKSGQILEDEIMAIDWLLQTIPHPNILD
jgi:hypothetical protein